MKVDNDYTPRIDWLIDCLTAHQYRKVISAKKRRWIIYDQDSSINTTVYEETLTDRPHDTSVQKATSDNENVDAVWRHAQDELRIEIRMLLLSLHNINISICSTQRSQRYTIPILLTAFYHLNDVILSQGTWAYWTNDEFSSLEVQRTNWVTLTIGPIVGDVVLFQEYPCSPIPLFGVLLRKLLIAWLEPRGRTNCSLSSMFVRPFAVNSDVQRGRYNLSVQSEQFTASPIEYY